MFRLNNLPTKWALVGIEGSKEVVIGYRNRKIFAMDLLELSTIFVENSEAKEAKMGAETHIYREGVLEREREKWGVFCM
ncbi:hypothetical protein Hanom_Chr01g00075201 [Helianthus anomalus]